MKAEFNADEVTSRDLILGLLALRSCRTIALTLLRPVFSGQLPAHLLPPGEAQEALAEAPSPEALETIRRLRSEVPKTNDEAAEAFLDALVEALQGVRSTRRIREILHAVPPPRNRTAGGVGSQPEDVFPGRGEMTVLDQVKLLIELSRSLWSSLDLFRNFAPDTVESQHLRAMGQSLNLLERLLRPFQSDHVEPEAD